MKKKREILRKEFPKLKPEYSVETFEIFGSFARNEQRNGLILFSTIC